MSTGPDTTPAQVQGVFAPVGFTYLDKGEKALEAAAKRVQALLGQAQQAATKTPAVAGGQAATGAQQVNQDRALTQAKIERARAERNYAEALRLTDQLIKQATGNEVQLERAQAQRARIQREQERANSGGFLSQVRGAAGQGVFAAAGAVGIATGIGALTSQVIQLGEESAELAKRAETIGRAFENATERAGIGSDALLSKLNTAARGTVADADLQLSANKALALGVGQNAQEIADLLAIARQKGKDFGTDTAKAFEDIVTGLGRASPLILDNLGITLDVEKVYRDYGKQVGVAASKLDDQQKKIALVNEVLRTNNGLIRDNGDAELDRADKQAQAEARRKNAQTRLGNAVAPIQTAIAEATATFLEYITGRGALQSEALDKINQDLLTNATSYEDYVKRTKAAQAELRAQAPAGFRRNIEGDIGTLTEEQFNAGRAAEAAQAKIQREELALQQLGRTSQSTGRNLDDLANNQKNLGDQAIAAAQQIADAAGRRDDALASAKSAHDTRLGELSSDLAKSAVKTEAAITEAVRKGAADRLKIQRDGAKAVATALEQAAKRAEQIETDYQKARARIIDEAEKRETARAKAAQQERLANERDYNEQLLTGRSNAIQQIYDLTRGPGGRDVRQSSLDALKQIEAEAAELAKTDAVAAGEYLAEKTRQLLAQIQRDKDVAQQQQDAQRGNPGFNRADFDQERRDEQAAIDAANQAAIDGILARSKDRQTAKDEAAAQDKADTETALADLETQRTADLQALKASTAAQISEIRASTAERLSEFDATQKERIQSIRDQGAAEVATIQAQIAAENTAYKKHVDEINAQYDQIRDEIVAKISAAANEVNLLPNEKRRKELLDAYSKLGTYLGGGLVNAINAAMAGVDPSSIGADPLGRDEARKARTVPSGTPQVPAGASTVTTNSTTNLNIPVDLRGASFNGGASATQTQQAVTGAITAAVRQLTQEQIAQIRHKRQQEVHVGGV